MAGLEVTFAVEIVMPQTIPIWMIHDHRAEMSEMAADIQTGLDWDSYMAAQAKKELLFVAARDAKSRELVGYMVMFIRPHPHYKSIKAASNDAHYLMPAYRGVGAGKAMIQFAEAAAVECGARVLVQRTKAKDSHGYIFQSMGYKLTDFVYVKDLRPK